MIIAMAVVRTALNVGRMFANPPQNPAQPKYLLMAWAIGVRQISTLEVTKNVVLLSKDKKNTKVVNFKLESAEDKPLVVLLSWLMAKKKHIYKYANLYLDFGFDVLNVNISPWQLLWPRKGTQVVASEILKFLHANESYTPLVLHGFSVGGYLWSEVMVQMAAEREKYQHIINRISGQVWDSAADVTEISIGMPIAVFPKNTVMQNALRQYILYHLKTFDKVATCHYIRGSQMFHTNLIKAPALFILSKTDPIGAVSSNLRAKESWENMGIEVFWKCFESSPHVGHMQKYPKEYAVAVTNFLEHIGVKSSVQNVQKMQAKL